MSPKQCTKCSHKTHKTLSPKFCLSNFPGRGQSRAMPITGRSLLGDFKIPKTDIIVRKDALREAGVGWNGSDHPDPRIAADSGPSVRRDLEEEIARRARLQRRRPAQDDLSGHLQIAFSERWAFDSFETRSHTLSSSVGSRKPQGQSLLKTHKLND